MDQYVPLWSSPRCVCTSGTAIEWTGPCSHTVCAHPRPSLLYHPNPCPPPHSQLQSPNWHAMLRGRLWVSVHLTIRWWHTTLALCQNFNTTTSPPVCDCSSSRTACFRPPPRWGCWRRHMMTHTKKPVDHVLYTLRVFLGRWSPRVVPVQTSQVSKKTTDCILDLLTYVRFTCRYRSPGLSLLSCRGCSEKDPNLCLFRNTKKKSTVTVTLNNYPRACRHCK